MCAKPLACPLCSQPAFLTLDALRTGLISVATRPLACPVCNEVLLGVDKLTIHLFSHAINLANDCKTNTIIDHGRIVSGNLYNKQNEENIRNEQYIPNEKSNFINKEAEVEIIQLFDRDDDLKLTSQVINEVAIIPELRKITSALNDSVNITNSTISTSSQTCDEDPVQSDETVQRISTNNRVVFLQNLQLKEDADKLKELRVDCVAENLSKESSKDPTDENYTKSILHFQPIWTSQNPQQEICLQNIIVTANNSNQILTISPEAGEGVLLTDENNTDIRKTEILKAQEHSSEEIKVLPQLKAFRSLATKEKTERCDVCGFYFSDPNILTLHKQLVHMINEKDVNKKPEDLLKNYPCHLCPKVFKMRGSLMVHMRVAHIGYNLGLIPRDGDLLPVPGENGYNCPTCGKNFKKEQHVTQHLKTHEGKQWECDVCSKMFTTKYFLKKHKRLHSGEMPYKCNICDKTFTFQQSYHKHRLYHKDDKPHACSTCGRSFKELSTLHNHERIHTGEKPFACETCGKCFRQRVSYLVHRRIHTGAMPYKCTACGKSFRYKVSQRTHKCTAQPPGTVVRQSSDLVQRLLQVRDSSIRESVGEGVSTQEDESIGCIPNEENRYILIINNQGQHVLTRQSEVEDKTVEAAGSNSDLNKYEDNKVDGETCIEDLWGHDIPDGTTLNDSIMEISDKNVSNDVEEENFRPDGNNDFFSMVLSPAENEVSSPASQMEHLRLSSPMNNNDNILEMKEASEILENNDNFNIGINKSMAQHNFETDNGRNSTLPTINEESLKQLLYGTESGQ